MMLPKTIVINKVSVLTLLILLLLSLYWTPNAKADSTYVDIPIFSDKFERSTVGPDWTITGGDPGIGIMPNTGADASNGFYIGEDNGILTTKVIDLSSFLEGKVSVWIRAGMVNANSLYMPEDEEYLAMGYFDQSGGFVELDRVNGGQPYSTEQEAAAYTSQFEFNLPASALHSQFRLVFIRHASKLESSDFFHIDDVVVSAPAIVGNYSYDCEDFQAPLSDQWEVNPSSQVSIHYNASYPYTKNLAINGTNYSWGTAYYSYDTSRADELKIDMKIMQGFAGYSELPDPGEYLMVYYAGADKMPRTLGRYDPVSGSDVTKRFAHATWDLSNEANAKHADFQLLFLAPEGFLPGYDVWHIDDICIHSTEYFSNAVPEIHANINRSVLLADPGDIIEFTTTIANQSMGVADNAVIVQSLPEFSSLKLDAYGADTPLAITVNSMDEMPYNVEYSHDNGNQFNYTLQSGSGGAPHNFDGNVTDFRIITEGYMYPDTEVDIKYKVRVH